VDETKLRKLQRFCGSFLGKLAILLVVLVAWEYWASIDRLEGHQVGTVTNSATWCVREWQRVRVDSGDKSIRVDLKRYNVETGGALRGPYDVLTFIHGEEKYVVTDQGVSGHKVIVNGEPKYLAGWTEHVLIRFGSGVSVERNGKPASPHV
jgi:hypothetical protein